MNGSTFISLAEFALLEYRYSTDVSTISDYGFVKVSNKSQDINLYVNENKTAFFTKNVLDYSSIRLGSGISYGSLDQDRTLKLYDIDTNIELTSLSIPSALSLEYDTVRLHILAGYNLDGVDGISVPVYFDENSGKRAYVSNFTFLKGEKTLQFSEKPFNIGEKLYDKYLEFKVPSLSNLNREFYLNQSIADKTLSHYLSSDGKGYKKESLINFEFWLYSNAVEENDILKLDGQLLSSASILPYDNNALLSATIKESEVGDYFEYFPVYDGDFIEDYLAELNSAGNDYYVINEIKIYENYGTLTNKETYNLSFVQTSDFDLPNKFRPILSNECYSFSIDYTFRLINNADMTQVIKTSSLSCDYSTAKKYGNKIGSIKVKESSAPIKIYNRRINSLYSTPIKDYFEKSVSLSDTGQLKVAEVVRYTTDYNISISTISSYIDSSKLLSDSTLQDSNTIYGNGKGYITLNRFDNYIRFNLFKTYLESNNKQNIALLVSDILSMDSENMENLNIVFINDSGGKMYIKVETSTVKDNSFVFHIRSSDAVRVLDYTNKNFYIVYKNSQGNEVSLYNGVYMEVLETEKIESFKNKEKSKIIENLTSKYEQTLLEIEKKRKENESILANIQAENAKLQSLIVANASRQSNILDNGSTRVSSSILNSTNDKKREKVSSSIKTVTTDKKTEDKKTSDSKRTIMDVINNFNVKVDSKVNPSGNVTKPKDNNILTTGPKSVGISADTLVVTESSFSDYVSKNVNLKGVPGKDENMGLESSIRDITPNFIKEM